MSCVASNCVNVKRSEPYQEIVSHLGSLSELFTLPAPDPFSARVRFIPEIETIKAALMQDPRHQGRKARVTIFLPKDHIEPDLAQQTRKAIQRYCLFKTDQNRLGMLALRRGAFQALLVGIVFLSSGILFSASIEKALMLPPFFHILFTDGFDLAFWVILWRPVDFFLFDASVFWREDRLHKRLMAMEVVVSEEPAL